MTNEMNVLNKKKVGIYTWHVKNKALKNLKKELLKKAENKKKSETEKSENKDFIEKMFQAFIDIYTWVKYDKGVDDIDDFLENIESYSDDFEGWFEFSDEFMNAFINVISSSKKNFGIAIERFKMMPFKFAMEDVPETLAEMMLDKFSKKRNLLAAAIIAGADPKKVYYNEYSHEIFEIGKKRLMGLGVPEKTLYAQMH